MATFEKNIAELLAAGKLHSEFDGIIWHRPMDQSIGCDPLALVTYRYSDEPSPETGHVGWCWWAMGRMGDAPTFIEAKMAAQRAVNKIKSGETNEGG
jgi:hypothetical protein